MVVGLGAGNTAILATRRIGQLWRQGRLRDIVGVPYSSMIEAEARALGILITLDPPGTVDLTIDGADESKLSPALATHWPLPVEVIPFGWQSQRRFLESLGAHVTVRQQSDGIPFRTDQGNLMLDCAFGPIHRPAELAAQLDARMCSCMGMTIAASGSSR